MRNLQNDNDIAKTENNNAIVETESGKSPSKWDSLSNYIQRAQCTNQLASISNAVVWNLHLTIWTFLNLQPVESTTYSCYRLYSKKTTIITKDEYTSRTLTIRLNLNLL